VYKNSASDSQLHRDNGWHYIKLSSDYI